MSFGAYTPLIKRDAILFVQFQKLCLSKNGKIVSTFHPSLFFLIPLKSLLGFFFVFFYQMVISLVSLILTEMVFNYMLVSD